MSTDSIQDSTRYLVKEEHIGSIMPGNRAEMHRDIYLQSGALIKGGIYGNKLSINGGNITVEGSTYCKSNIKFNFPGNINKDVVFQSTVVCPGTILIPPFNGKIRFLSDVYSGKINLKNCIVYGNVYATSATLEDSIILGGIYCKNQLKLKNSIVFTFRSNHSLIDDHVSILSPFGFSEQISMNSNVNVLSFKSLFNSNETIQSSGKLKLDETDIYEIELEKKDESDGSAGKKIQILSVAERLLNTSEIIEHFKQNKKFIVFLSLNSHLIDEDKESFITNNKEELENGLWQIIEDKSDFKELVGAKSIEEMFNEYS